MIGRRFMLGVWVTLSASCADAALEERVAAVEAESARLREELEGLKQQRAAEELRPGPPRVDRRRLRAIAPPAPAPTSERVSGPDAEAVRKLREVMSACAEPCATLWQNLSEEQITARFSKVKGSMQACAAKCQ